MILLISMFCIAHSFSFGSVLASLHFGLGQSKHLAMCRLQNATLVVAKLDRLARNTQFLLTVVNQSGDKGVVFCDLPTIPEGPTGKFLLTQMASVAELEAQDSSASAPKPP
jgi:DNA invertase Pin-like site-specific DNA recombinase